MDSYNELQNICVSVFESVAKTTSIFILPLFLGRVVFSGVFGDGSQTIQTLKSVVIYFCLIAGFPYVLDIMFSIPETFTPKLSQLSEFQGELKNFDSSTIPFWLDCVLEVVLAGLYWIAYYLHIFFMLIMCSAAPIVFLTGTLLGIGIGMEVFLGLLVIGSCWPIIWFGFDQVHTALSISQTDSFGARCLELLLTIFKGLAPLTFASAAIKSPAGKAISSTLQGTIRAGNLAVAMTSRGKAFSTSANMPYPQPTVSKSLTIARKMAVSHFPNKDKLTESRVRSQSKDKI